MNQLKKSRYALSLIQTIIVIFVAIILLVGGSAVVSSRGISKIGSQFEKLSENALPLAMYNAKLTQNVLEQVKVLNQGLQEQSSEGLQVVQQSIDLLSQESDQIVSSLFTIAKQFDQAITAEQKELLNRKMRRLAALSRAIIQGQNNTILLSQKVDELVPPFRYGMRSIGPEMSRIASFLVQDNPEASDAANRFVSQSSEMESTFMLLLMQAEVETARKEVKEMKNRFAGVDLAYDDFADWHPDVNDFASLTAPFDMVKEGFAADGVLDTIVRRLEVKTEQKQQLIEASQLANESITLLNEISTTAEQLIISSRTVVRNTMHTTWLMIIVSGVAMALFVLVAGLYLRIWINRGLKNIIHHLNLLTEHNFTGRAACTGPYEMQEIALKLNQVIASTQESVKTVADNCETLYKTAGDSHVVAEETEKYLNAQNDSLAEMVSAIEQLQASINEIASVTADSYNESEAATNLASEGAQALDQNTQHLNSLEQTLLLNENAMSELDNRVSQIREMVDVISGIADSTNLLALNAAIEAARAGEQGRGFAVVADEVRKLASGTSEQTENIRAMMNELVQAAQRSRTAVQESRSEMVSALDSNSKVKETFTDIEESVNRIRLRVEQVSVATEEQERATANVSDSIGQVNQQGGQTKQKLQLMVDSSEQVANIAGHQQVMLHKYHL